MSGHEPTSFHSFRAGSREGLRVLRAPNLDEFPWLTHGFGQRHSVYPEPITTVKQIHSDVIIEAPVLGGDRFAEADALVARQPGMVVGVRTADCVPILLVDKRTRAVAAIHAGWRGTAKNIVAKTVLELFTRYGSCTGDLYAAIGPSIGPCCYEVGSDVAREFLKWTKSPGGKLDLPAVNEAQLRQAGISNVWKADVCTFCTANLYFSFRRERGQAGRMLSFAGYKNTSGGDS